MSDSKYLIDRKEFLTDEELEEYFEIEKPLYLKIFGEIKDEFKQKFFTKRKSLFYNPNYFNYKITKDGILCGYVSFIIFEDELYLYDITFANNFKRTRLILEIITFALKIEEFKRFDKLYFAVDNKNDISYKTWIHLGAKIESKQEFKSSYFIDRDSVNKYISSLMIKN